MSEAKDIIKDATKEFQLPEVRKKISYGPGETRTHAHAFRPRHYRNTRNTPIRGFDFP